MSRPYTITQAHEPLLAAAVHAGHELRPAVDELIALDADERLREEDPYTDGWTAVAGSRAVVHRSRFEVDLNRPREGCVYVRPEDAWGLRIWRQPPPARMIERSRAIHDRFYADLRHRLETLERAFGRFVVYDLHSYNHRRGGPEAPPADPHDNPEVNVGTGTLDRSRWGPVVDGFIEAMRAFDFGGRSLDVRENVRFRGGYLSSWVNNTFGLKGCAFAIEVKKFFMDEHTGSLDEPLWKEVLRALGETVPPVLDALDMR